MPSSVAVCRICLASNVRMFKIAGTPLHFVYETLANTVLHTPDHRPETACYICHAQLVKCRKLMLKTVKAEKLLTAVLERHPMATDLSALLGDQSTSLSSLCTIPVECTDTTTFNAPIVVKPEPEYPEVVVKLEMDCDASEGSQKSLHIDYNSETDAEDNVPLKSLSAAQQPNVEIEVKVEADILGNGEPKNLKEDEGTLTNPNLEGRDSKTKPQDGLECNLCQRKFNTKGSFNRHVRLHTGEKPFQCQVCQNRFAEKSTLQRHLKTHSGEKNFECDICHRRFVQNTHLQTHLRTHTGEKPFECTNCSRRFSEKKTLLIHVRTHTGEKPYECKICHCRFRHKANLRGHSRSHSGDTPHECTICHRRFTRKSHLRIHIRTHTGEKPYQCNFCERRFNQKIALQNHTRTHTGEVPFECQYCQKRFTRKDNLMLHLRKHTDEKPYQCDVCQRRFIENRALRSHIRSHTGEKPHECDVCHNRFSHKYTLQRHMRSHSSDAPQATTPNETVTSS